MKADFCTKLKITRKPQDKLRMTSCWLPVSGGVLVDASNNATYIAQTKLGVQGVFPCRAEPSVRAYLNTRIWVAHYGTRHTLRLA